MLVETVSHTFHPSLLHPNQLHHPLNAAKPPTPNRFSISSSTQKQPVSVLYQAIYGQHHMDTADPQPGGPKIQTRAGMLGSHSMSSLFGDGKGLVISQFLTYFVRLEVKASRDRNTLCKNKEELHLNTSAWLLQPTSTGMASAPARETSRRASMNNFHNFLQYTH